LTHTLHRKGPKRLAYRSELWAQCLGFDWAEICRRKKENAARQAVKEPIEGAAIAETSDQTPML